MTEQLRLQWKDFKENITNAFATLRDDNDLSDVTLVCEDGKQIDAHRVVLCISSPLFQNVFQIAKPFPKNEPKVSQPLELQANVGQEDIKNHDTGLGTVALTSNYSSNLQELNIKILTMMEKNFRF